MAFRPPAAIPATESRLRVGADGAFLGPGDIPVIGGKTLIVRPSQIHEHGLVLDAPRQLSIAPAGIFVPDVSTFPATTLNMPDETAYLQMVELAVAGAAPAAGTDADNHWRIRVAGTSQGEQTLPMHTEGGRIYRYSTFDDIQLGAHNRHNSRVNAAGAYAQQFRVSTAVTIASLRGRTPFNDTWLWNTTGSPDEYLWLRMVLIGPDGEYLATSHPVWSGTYSDDLWVDFPLGESVDLAQNTDYWVGYEPVTGHSGGGTLVGFSVATNSNGGSTWDTGIVDTTNRQMLQTDSPDNWDARQATTPSAQGPQARLPFQLMGAPSGLLVGGHLEIEFEQIGSPPNAPTDVNVRFNWATASVV